MLSLECGVHTAGSLGTAPSKLPSLPSNRPSQPTRRRPTESSDHLPHATTPKPVVRKFYLRDLPIAVMARKRRLHGKRPQGTFHSINGTACPFDCRKELEIPMTEPGAENMKNKEVSGPSGRRLDLKDFGLLLFLMLSGCFGCEKDVLNQTANGFESAPIRLEREEDTRDQPVRREEACIGAMQFGLTMSRFKDCDAISIEFTRDSTPECHQQLLTQIKGEDLVDLVLTSQNVIKTDVMRSFVNIGSLKYLEINGKFSILDSLENIWTEYLRLINTEDSPTLLKHVCNMKMLKYLSIYLDLNNNYQYNFLRDCIYLKGIKINANTDIKAPFTDQDLEAVLSIENLEILDVSNTRVTIDGLLRALQKSSLKKVFACELQDSAKLTRLPHAQKMKLFYWGECRCSSFLHFGESSWVKRENLLKPVIDLRTSNDYYYLDKYGEGCKWPGLP